MRRLLRTFRYYLERTGFRFRLRSFLFFDLKLSDVQLGANESDFKIRSIDLAELGAEHVIGWLSFDQAQKHLAEPHFRLFVAFLDNMPVGSCWLESKIGELDFMDFHEELPANSAYVTHVIVKAEKRGCGVAERLIDFACAEATRIGKERMVICCVPENTAVRKTISKRPWENYLTIYYFRFMVLPIYLCFRANGQVRDISISMNHRSLRLLQRNMK